MGAAGDGWPGWAAFVDAKHVIGQGPSTVVARGHGVECILAPLVVVVSRVWVCWSEVVLDFRAVRHPELRFPAVAPR